MIKFCLLNWEYTRRALPSFFVYHYSLFVVTEISLGLCDYNELYSWKRRDKFGLRFPSKQVTRHPSLTNSNACETYCVNNLTCAAFAWNGNTSCYTATSGYASIFTDIAGDFKSELIPCKPSES